MDKKAFERGSCRLCHDPAIKATAKDWSAGYSIEDLDKVLLKFVSQLFLDSARRPNAVDEAAQRIFVDRIPENEDTDLIRQAWNDLHTHTGAFNFLG